MNDGAAEAEDSLSEGCREPDFSVPRRAEREAAGDAFCRAPRPGDDEVECIRRAARRVGFDAGWEARDPEVRSLEAEREHWREHGQRMAREDEAGRERVRALSDALRELDVAAEPYMTNAAPHEELFNGEDLRNFDRLASAKALALAALPGATK